MNNKQANAVPISDVLEKMGHVPVKEKNSDKWYLSPFRKEKTASFKVNILKNVWYDHGEGRGGNVVDLVAAHLESTGQDHQNFDALRWMRNMTFVYAPVKFTQKQIDEECKPKLILNDAKKLDHLGLIKYLESRGIPFEVATNYVKEVRIFNTATSKRFTALGFKNNDGGWEIKNDLIKSCIAPKTFTFFRGRLSNYKYEKVNIFEGIFDFLSIASLSNDGFLDGDSIVLNSVNCLSHSYHLINGYTSACSWFDNDEKGLETKLALDEFVKTQEGMTHFPMNHKYKSYKDVNEWHMHQHNLSN